VVFIGADFSDSRYSPPLRAPLLILGRGEFKIILASAGLNAVYVDQRGQLAIDLFFVAEIEFQQAA
jgi:hypothetical protein